MNLHDLLIQLSDYFERFQDIDDNGGPNEAMKFKQDIDEVLDKLYTTPLSHKRTKGKR